MNTEVIINIPTEFKKLDESPEPNTVAFAKQTESSDMFVMIYYINNEDAMPYGNEKEVIDDIHEAFQGDVGLVEVQSGTTKNQKRYIYNILKTPLEQSGMQYVTTIHIDMNDFSISIQLYFSEAGMTGLRDNVIMNKMISEGKIIPPNMNGWFKDPYDENYKNGLLRNESEKPEYDAMFPEHPLSETRNFIKYVIENN